jgi:hypothetical protein
MKIDPLQPGSPRDDGAKIEPQNARTGKSPTIGAAESGFRAFGARTNCVASSGHKKPGGASHRVGK